MRFLLTDDRWSLLEPLVIRAKGNPAGQRPRLSERLFFEALLYVARTGIPWRDLPGDFGAWDAIDHRFRRWTDTGRLTRLFELLTATPAFGDLRRACLRRGVMPQLAAGTNRPEADLATYSDAYRQRNRIERLFAKLKQFRRIATRYDKLKKTFHGFLALTFGFIRLRSLA